LPYQVPYSWSESLLSLLLFYPELSHFILVITSWNHFGQLVLKNGFI